MVTRAVYFKWISCLIKSLAHKIGNEKENDMLHSERLRLRNSESWANFNFLRT